MEGIDESIFLLDGAPGHFARIARNWLSANFPNRWIGRGGDLTEWPARSPDLTPMDYFFWGFVKNKTYQFVPKNRQELIRAIRLAFGMVTPEMLANTRRNWAERLCHTIACEGQHIEPYMR